MTGTPAPVTLLSEVLLDELGLVNGILTAPAGQEQTAAGSRAKAVRERVHP